MQDQIFEFFNDLNEMLMDLGARTLKKLENVFLPLLGDDWLAYIADTVWAHRKKNPLFGTPCLQVL